MKLDVNVLRYLSKEDFRVLTAVEMGQKNHEIVPMQLIDSISGLKHGGAFRCLKTLLQHKLVHHEGHKYDGYRLTYMGYDFLAIKALVARGHISGVGRQIGVGKESDIFEVTNDEGEVFALKLHRLGRTSFRDVKSKRDYLGNRSSYSWLYLSRLAALKEFAFMKALGDHGFPVPVAIDNNRHAVLMELVDAQPLVQVRELAHPADVYQQAMALIYRLAARGLIHCDFNEFNLLIDDDEQLTLIDFPQMVSVSHANAEELFERDVECIIRFFNKKIGYVASQDASKPSERPSFAAAAAAAAEAGAAGLDVELSASGFRKEHQEDLEALLGGGLADAEEDEGSEEDEEHEEEQSASEEVDSEAADGEEDEQAGSGSDSAAAAACKDAQDVDDIAEQLAAKCSSNQQQQQANTRKTAAAAAASSSMHRWLDEHAAAAAGSDIDAAAAAAATDGSSDELDGTEEEGTAAAAAAAAVSQQQGWDAARSVAPSRAPTDISFMGREVQQRLVQQRQKAAARAAASKASRNVSKAKSKKAKKTAAAMADW